jgi:predicted nucleotidyltransferase
VRVGDDAEHTIEAAGRLAEVVDAILGEGVRSVVLHGSLAAGGFRSGRSDLDLLVVVEDALTDEQVEELEAAVRRADLGDAAGVDLHVVTAVVAGAPTPDPVLELYVGRSSQEVEITRRTRDPDLVAELSMARADGRGLRGAAPSESIASVPAQWVVDRNRFWLSKWQTLTGDEKNAAFMVLTACRGWRFAVEHVHSPKGEAAAWALDRDPTLDVVRQTVQQYDGDPGVRIDPDGIARLLDRVLAETTDEA